MGLFKTLFGDAAEELKKSYEDAKKDRIVRIVNAIDSNIVVEKLKRKDIKFWREQ